MTDKLPLREAISKWDMRLLRKAILHEHIQKEVVTEYGEHVSATFNLLHDLFCGIRATMEIHEIDENGRLLGQWTLAQTVVNAVILCADWPEDHIGLDNADPEFKVAFYAVLEELNSSAGGTA